MVILELGICCVIAKIFARIFYRDAINIGLPILEYPDASEKISAGDEVSLDFSNGVITNISKTKNTPPHLSPILSKKLSNQADFLPRSRKNRGKHEGAHRGNSR